MASLMLVTCRACNGLSPAQARRCLHCNVRLSRSSFGLGLLAVAGAGISAVTLMACYGMPACDHQADGGVIDNGRCVNYQVGETADAGRDSGTDAGDGG